MPGRFRVNAPQVISEVIDGEVVIINLGSGDYFSLRGSGSYIWRALDLGADTTQIVEAYTGAGLGQAADLERAVRGLVEQLESEALVVPAPDAALAGSLPAPDGDTFEPPALEKFTDMQDLILLDPVHEVDEPGWPHATPQR